MKSWLLALACSVCAASVSFAQEDDWLDGFDDLFAETADGAGDAAQAVADEVSDAGDAVAESAADWTAEAADAFDSFGGDDWSDLAPEAVEEALNDAQSFGDDAAVAPAPAPEAADAEAWLDDTLGIETPEPVIDVPETVEIPEEEIWDLPEEELAAELPEVIEDFPEPAPVAETEPALEVEPVAEAEPVVEAQPVPEPVEVVAPVAPRTDRPAKANKKDRKGKAKDEDAIAPAAPVVEPEPALEPVKPVLRPRTSEPKAKPEPKKPAKSAGGWDDLIYW